MALLCRVGVGLAVTLSLTLMLLADGLLVTVSLSVVFSLFRKLMTLSLWCLSLGSWPKSVVTLMRAVLDSLMAIGPCWTRSITCRSWGLLLPITLCRLVIGAVRGVLAVRLSRLGVAVWATDPVGCTGNGVNSVLVAVALYGCEVLFTRAPVLVPRCVHSWPKWASTAWQ